MEKSVLWYFYAKMEQIKRMDEITGLDESDKNALITNIREN